MGIYIDIDIGVDIDFAVNSHVDIDNDVNIDVNIGVLPAFEFSNLMQFVEVKINCLLQLHPDKESIFWWLP